jgi:hypothetical protein
MSQIDENENFDEQVHSKIMSLNARESFLKESLLFRNFTSNMLFRLLKTMTLEVASYKQNLVFQNEPNDGFLIVISGEVTLTHLVDEPSADNMIPVTQPLAPVKSSIN